MVPGISTLTYLLTYLQLALDKSLWRLLVASGATH